MRKVKITLILLLAIAAIVLGGTLPMIVGALWDQSAGNQIHYRDTQEIHLEFTKEEAPSLTEKLALLSQRGDRIAEIQVAPESAQMSEDKVIESVLRSLLPYQALGLIPVEIDISCCPYECIPVMIYSIDNPTRGSLFWRVTIYTNTFSGWTIYLLVDDQTGKPLEFEFNLYNSESYLVPSEEYLMMLVQNYFEALDLWEQIGTLEIPATEHYSNQSVGVEFSWNDETYGNLRVAFLLHSTGFSNYWGG